MKDTRPKNGSPGAQPAPWHNAMSRAKVVNVATQLEAALIKAQKDLAEQRARADKYMNTLGAIVLGASKETGELVVPYDDCERLTKRRLQLEAERTSPTDIVIRAVLVPEEAGSTAPSAS